MLVPWGSPILGGSGDDSRESDPWRIGAAFCSIGKNGARCQNGGIRKPRGQPSKKV